MLVKKTIATAYFSSGHGEKSPFDLDDQNGLSAFSEILQDRNIKVATIDLSLTKRVPDDALMLVIGGPKGTFQEQEVAGIQSFLNRRGGKLILAIDPFEELSVLDRPAFGLGRSSKNGTFDVMICLFTMLVLKTTIFSLGPISQNISEKDNQNYETHEAWTFDSKRSV